MRSLRFHRYTIGRHHPQSYGWPARAVGVAPVGKAPGRIQIGSAGVVVVDLRGEEFEKAPGGFGVRGKQAGGLEFRSGGQGDCGRFHGFDDRV